jgi:hypothetical protein
MFAWPVRIPPPRRRVARGGSIRHPQAQSSMDHPLFRSAQNPPSCRLQAPRPAGAALAGVPAPQEQLWRVSLLRRNSSGGHPAPQEQLWRASPLRRSALAAAPTPQEHHKRPSPPRRSKFSPVHPPPMRRET